jgi:hypothetical protein
LRMVESARDNEMNKPFEVVTVHGSEAESTWNELRTRPGVVPVLLGDRAMADAAMELVGQSSETFDEIEAAGLAFDVKSWIAERVEENAEYFEYEEVEDEDLGSIPCFTPAFDIGTGEPLEEVCFGLIPVESSWLVPAFLKIGGWNDCPDASVHVAFFRRWSERYGAEVVTVANDVIEFRVSRPPRTPEDARQLAIEQYLYCTDIVEQGVGTLANLKASLIDSPNWYFWWD